MNAPSSPASSAKPYLILLLGVVTVALGVLAWQQYGELVELRAAAMNRDERADFQKRLWVLERQNRELQRTQASAPQPGGESGTAETPERKRAATETADRASPVRPGAREPAAHLAQQAAAIRELMNKPEVQGLLNFQQKAAIDQRYSALFRNLNLAPEQIEKLKTLLVERSTTTQDVMAAAREQGINPRANPEAFRKLLTDTQNQVNEGIRSLLGETGFAQMTQYERTLPQRNLVNELQQRLSYTNTPLSPAQAEQMVQVLAANPPQRPAAKTAASPAAPRGVDVGALVTNAITAVPGVGTLLGVAGDDAGKTPVPLYPVSPNAVAQAQTVLAPPQLAALQQLQQQQQAQAQLKQLVTETLVAAQPPGAPAPAPARKGPPGG